MQNLKKMKFNSVMQIITINATKQKKTIGLLLIIFSTACAKITTRAKAKNDYSSQPIELG